jgi:voltage-gated potassium channel
LLWLAALAILLGAVAFALTQRVPFFTALYWAVTTASTVGYGDVTPKNAAGRVVAIGVMVTAIPLMAAVFANLAAGLASNRMRRMLGLDEVKLRNHLIVFGYNPIVASMLGELAGRHAVLVVADVDSTAVPGRVQLMAGDPTQSEVVERARPDTASRALIAGETDAAVLMTAVLVKHFAPKLSQTALVQSPKVAEALGDLGVQHCIATDNLIGHTVAKSLETPHAGDLLLGIIGSSQYSLRERPVPQDWVGMRLSEVRSRYAGVMLGILHQQKVVLGVDHDPVVENDDQMFVLESDH